MRRVVLHKTGNASMISSLFYNGAVSNYLRAAEIFTCGSASCAIVAYTTEFEKLL